MPESNSQLGVRPGYVFAGFERRGHVLVALFALDYGDGARRSVAVPCGGGRLGVHACAEDELSTGDPELDRELETAASEWLAAIRSVGVVRAYDREWPRQRALRRMRAAA